MKMKVAIVEDEKKLAISLKDGLESEGYEVVLFYDGESAERELLQNSSEYTIIILDLMLPKKNGFEVCQILRKESVITPILILTARESTEDKVRALDSGADDFLTKPFSFDELMARMRALTRRAKGQVSQKVTVRDLIVNMGTREVSRGTKSIYLTPTEFDILTMFIENPERVNSREAIALHLWDSKDTSLSNVVDVHISNLRKKIDDDYDEKIIRTVRGLGYTIQK